MKTDNHDIKSLSEKLDLIQKDVDKRLDGLRSRFKWILGGLVVIGLPILGYFFISIQQLDSEKVSQIELRDAIEDLKEFNQSEIASAVELGYFRNMETIKEDIWEVVRQSNEEIESNYHAVLSQLGKINRRIDEALE